jgi:hypothetical protein
MSYASLGQSLQYRTTYNFHVTPNANGVFTMPAFSARGNARTVPVPSRQLTVLPAGSRPAARQMRLLAQLPPGDYFIGQSVPVLAVMADSGDNSVLGLIQPRAEGDAFIIDQNMGRQWRETRNIDGKNVQVLINELSVTPVKEGRLALTVQAFVVQQRTNNHSMIALPSYYPLYDSDPIEVPVKHLPPGELPGFTGLIGTFKISSTRLSTNEVAAGNPVYLTVSVSGQGNLPRLTPPKLDRVPGWQVFPAVRDMNPGQIIQMLGSNVFGYAMVPLSDRIKATPKIPFSYFDPKAMAYVDLSIPPAPIRVLKAASLAGSGGATNDSRIEDDLPSPSPEAEPVLAAIVDRPGRRVQTMEPLHRRFWFLAMQLIPAGAVAGLWAWDRRRRFLALHPEVVRKRRARRGLRRQWRLLRRAADAGDASGFVRASVDALREACAPHFAANPHALVCEDVLGELPLAQRQGSEGDMVRSLFRSADLTRFVGPAPEASALLALRAELERVLAGLRRRL